MLELLRDAASRSTRSSSSTSASITRCGSQQRRGDGAGAGRPAEVLLQVASPASLMQVASRLHQCVNLPRSHEKGALVKLATGSLLPFYYWALIYKNYI